MTGILFVGLGNVCRSPAAQAVFADLLHMRNLDADVVVDSAGIVGDHLSKPPCDAMRQEGARRGFEMSHGRARQVTPEDFHRFDYIFAMDRAVLRVLQRMASPEPRAHVGLFLAYAPELGEDVPDPYHAPGIAASALDIIEEGAMALLTYLLQHEICP
ncbi:MAG TPA: low molecular weight phosphotyrosine protein phosphatase [Anaerolineae bacterium]|nr:low molecular weight phosphotyrosine protein phosphatase [Anaerolineae bacterium]